MGFRHQWHSSILKGLILLSFFVAQSFAATNEADGRKDFNIIVVDKATNQAHLTEFQGDSLVIKKSYHVTLGKSQGDKKQTGDLKTPEGIYFFTLKLTPPKLKKKFGVMAFLTDYPNPMDKKEGKTGFDIMLHATDDATRLKKDFDSEGCVVVGNDEITEYANYIRLGLTPILIYGEFKPEFLKAESTEGVRKAFLKWKESWMGKDIDTYIASYRDDFRFGGMNLKQYKNYKSALNKRYSKIKIEVEHVHYYYHPKYYVVTFAQHYESRLNNGAKGFISRGTKTLYFVREGESYKIAQESFSKIREE